MRSFFFDHETDEHFWPIGPGVGPGLRTNRWIFVKVGASLVEHHGLRPLEFFSLRLYSRWQMSNPLHWQPGTTKGRNLVGSTQCQSEDCGLAIRSVIIC